MSTLILPRQPFFPLLFDEPQFAGWPLTTQDSGAAIGLPNGVLAASLRSTRESHTRRGYAECPIGYDPDPRTPGSRARLVDAHGESWVCDTIAAASPYGFSLQQLHRWTAGCAFLGIDAWPRLPRLRVKSLSIDKPEGGRMTVPYFHEGQLLTIRKNLNSGRVLHSTNGLGLSHQEAKSRYGVGEKWLKKHGGDSWHEGRVMRKLAADGRSLSAKRSHSLIVMRVWSEAQIQEALQTAPVHDKQSRANNLKADIAWLKKLHDEIEGDRIASTDLEKRARQAGISGDRLRRGIQALGLERIPVKSQGGAWCVYFTQAPHVMWTSPASQQVYISQRDFCRLTGWVDESVRYYRDKRPHKAIGRTLDHQKPADTELGVYLYALRDAKQIEKWQKLGGVAWNQAALPEAAQELARQFIAEDGVKSKDEPGATARRRDSEDDAQEKNKICYAIYISGRQVSLALQEARAVLGAKAPRSWGVLSIRASRWAKKNGLSLERKR